MIAVFFIMQKSVKKQYHQRKFKSKYLDQFTELNGIVNFINDLLFIIIDHNIYYNMHSYVIC